MTLPDPISITAVVSRFPAPSQTFIQRKLVGLRDAGVHVTVAAGTFNPGADALGMDLLPMMPWREPRRALSPVNRPAWRATATGVRALSGQRGLGPKERVALAPLLGSHSDIVHFEFSGIAVTYRQILERLRPAKLAVSCRGAAEQIVPLADPTRGPQLAEVFGTVDLIHCVSDDIRRTVESLGAPADRIVVNRPAVPVEEFTQLAADREDGPGHDELRVLSIGRLHWKKGFDDALRAVSRLADRGVDVRYRIAGEGDEREKLSFLVGELGLAERVELLGSCTQEQVREQLAWADALLLPSLSEGISNAVLEAMSAGLPVISTNCGGMAEVIDDGVDGLLVDVGDLDAMADHLETLAADLDLRARLGRAASVRARRDHDVSRQISVFVDAYERLLS